MKQLAQLAQLVLLAAALLTAPACSKKEEAPPAAATGSYALDGRKVVATAVSGLYAAGSAGTDDMLSIQLVSAGGGSGSETLEAIYAKRAGSPESTYRPLSLRYTNPTGVTYAYSLDLAMTLTKTDSGYSGTFAGAFQGLGKSQISEGAFANVR